MIDTLHTSVLHGVLCALGPVDCVRLASCSKYFHQTVMRSACYATSLPILRERLKDACWSLLQAGYCIEISNTLASFISSAKSKITFTCKEQHECNCYIIKAHETTPTFYFEGLSREIEIDVDDKKMFSEVFDRYIIHTNARLQRSKRDNHPTVRNKKLEKHFARCAEHFSTPSHCKLPIIV